MWLLSFNCKSFISLRDVVACPKPKSYNKPCVLIVFPGYWMVVSNGPHLGTVFDGTCCFC